MSHPTNWHVSSTKNRDSIRRHGLDWRLMGPAPGIAGSVRPEQEGCFLCLSPHHVDFFVRGNNTDGPVDVWEVAAVDPDALIQSPEGFYFFPGVIGPERLRLVREDVPKPVRHLTE